MLDLFGWILVVVSLAIVAAAIWLIWDHKRNGNGD